MQEINTTIIEEAAYNLCVKANTQYDSNLYKLILDKFNKETEKTRKAKLKNILLNIALASKNQRPLCQDTGQVIVFVEIGQSVSLRGTLLNDSINNAVKQAYTENYFRKSVVKNSIFDRDNTKTNTPAIIYTEITSGDKVTLRVLIKGAGAENYSAVKMFKPTSEKEEIFEFIKDTVETAGEKACPPLVIGIGSGGTLEQAGILSKKAFFNNETTKEEAEFLEEIRKQLPEESILDIRIKTAPTHIASLPIAITINCHSTRHSCCEIENNSIKYLKNDTEYQNFSEDTENLKEIKAQDIESVKALQSGEDFLLTGEIYTARDAAHQRILAFYKENGYLPFELKDKIIFYAGPCPTAPNEIIGPIGPTTAARMDKFNDLMHKAGVLATIGKGERDDNYPEKYFTLQGGISCLIEQKVKSSEIVAFEDLGTEAVRKLYVERLPLTVEK